ncbi:ATP-dependent DNA ligase, partial [Nocardia tengchongensis]
MLLSEVVEASARVRATSSRKNKINILAELLEQAEPQELAQVVAWLSGELIQGRIGTGWRTLTALEVVSTGSPGLTVETVDNFFDQLAGVGGSGSAARRQELLADLFGAATGAEHDFLIRLLTGEMRQGALTAIVAEAVAAAYDVPIAAVRRAHMLSGRLPVTAVGGAPPPPPRRGAGPRPRRRPPPPPPAPPPPPP